MLVDDCKNDDCNCGNHSPSKKANLSPFVWRGVGFGSVDVLAREKGILFFDVAFRGVVGRWACKKGFVACHGERLGSKATKGNNDGRIKGCLWRQRRRPRIER